MKIRFYLATAIVALSWMGCSQEEATNEIMSGANVIQATIESSSRSAVTDAGVFSWTTGDEISLLDANNKDTYTYSGTGNGFNPPASVTVTAPVVAYYPANENHTTTKFYLPVTYGNTDTEYVASTNAAMIATPPTTGNTYAFMHLGGVMRFNVKNVPVNADGFIFTVSGKKITGEFEVKSGTTKTIATEDDPSSNNTVIIRFKKLTEAKDMTFYVPMPTGTYRAYTVGLHIDGQNEFNEHTSTNVTNTIARKTLLLMPTFTWNGTSLVKGEAIAGVIDLEDGSQSADITGDAEVVVTPGTDADAVATLIYAPEDDGSSVLSISDGSGATESGESKGKVLVSTANGSTVASCDINTPSLTVELSAAENGIATYEEVTALTAEQTLIIGEGVTVEKLVLKGGNVELKGNVISIESEVPTTIKLMNDINLDSAWEIEEGMNVTLNLNGKTLTGTFREACIKSSGNLTIKNGYITNVGGAVLATGGTLNMTDCEVTMTGGYRENAVEITGETTAVITGGKYTATGTLAAGEATDWYGIGIVDGTVTLNTTVEGTFNGGVTLAPDGTRPNVTITGGSYSGQMYHGLNMNGGDLTLNGDMEFDGKGGDIRVYTLTGTINGKSFGEYGNQTYTLSELIAIIGSTTEETTVATPESLVAAVATGGKVKLGMNMTLNEALTISNDVTLNLNGKTLTGNVEGYLFESNGNLTISNGNITNTGGAVKTTGGTLNMTDCNVTVTGNKRRNAVYITEITEAVITGGCYKATGTLAEGESTDWYGIGIVDGKLTLNTTVEGTFNGGVTLAPNGTRPNVTITGGSYSGQMYHGLNMNGGDLTLKEDTEMEFEGNGGDIRVYTKTGTINGVNFGFTLDGKKNYTLEELKNVIAEKKASAE